MSERPPYPTERSLAEAREEQAALRTHVAYPGRVQSYNASTQTADVVPLIRQQVPQPDGSYALEELPVVPSVPVVWPRVGGWFVAMALVPGDTVQLVVNTSAIGHWRAGDGSVTDPGDLRRQHLAHAVAIPGLYVRQKALAHAPTPTGSGGALAATDAALVIGSDANGPRVTLRPNGTVQVTQGSAVVIEVDASGVVHLGGAAGSFVALAPLVDAIVSSLKSAVAGWTPVPNDGGASLKAVVAAWSPSSTAATHVKGT